MTIEPLEALLIIVGSVTLFRSLEIFIRSLIRYKRLVDGGRCEAIRLLGWIKVRESGKNALWCFMVLGVGITTAFQPFSPSANPYRIFFQIGWILGAIVTLVAELKNENDVHRVGDIIEEERMRVDKS